MGGIAGMIRFDGRTGNHDDEIKLGDALRHRGTQQTKVVNKGTLFNFGGQVEEDTLLGTCVTADAIVYSPAVASISAGFDKYGFAFLNQLQADFALVLWNSQTNVLIGARDPLGVKPLYYVHQPGRFIAFSSEVKGLLSLTEVPTVPNENKFYEYLTWPTDYVPYSNETFYENIYSVLPGHFIQATLDQVKSVPYWQPNLRQFTSTSDPAFFAESFRTLFERAIERRIQFAGLVGAHLSGGLDSSSVCCVAQTILSRQQRPTLCTFNIDTELPSADEQTYVQTVREAYPVNHHRVLPLANILDSIRTIQHQFDRPEQFVIPSSFHLSVTQKAQQLGCHLILTGHDGDSVAANGFNFIDQLMERADWESLLQACSQFVSFSERDLTFIDPNWQQFPQSIKLKKYIVHLLTTKLKRQFTHQPVSQFCHTFAQQKRALGFSLLPLVNEITKRVWHRLTHRRLIDNAFSASFKTRVVRSQPLSTAALTDGIYRESGVSATHLINTTNVICNEQLNHMGAHAGHRYSFPFFDKNVIELGLSTPLGVHFYQGRGRGLIRQGLQGIVPARIITRYTKANFLEYSNVSAQQLYWATIDVLLEKHHPVWEIIDRNTFQSIVNVVFAPTISLMSKVRYNWLLSRIIYLAVWLKF